MTEPLVPGDVIGILGGGQLGRMLSVAAARLGFKTRVFEPS
ncbi:MAG: 5-(carboxyamino)imidazole ribonucleotide synthase, partial [Pseudomonadota bacterium]